MKTRGTHQIAAIDQWVGAADGGPGQQRDNVRMPTWQHIMYKSTSQCNQANFNLGHMMLIQVDAWRLCNVTLNHPP